MTTHTHTFPTEPRVTAGYGMASRRAIVLAVTAIAGVGVLVVWGLTALVG
ncbi:MAG: hypothetical protein WB802_11545 [Candidatus Dormiibacterota bacterium]|jgi:hypothetical protein